MQLLNDGATCDDGTVLVNMCIQYNMLPLFRKHHKTTNHARIRRQWAATLCEILT